MAIKDCGDRVIKIRNAREHNLQGVNLNIPRDRLIVVTGLSGSGKSSLAFDTIYAEGRRRYVESLSAYARQFLGQMSKPDVETIEGLPPTISIEQRSHSASPRSTVATTTEIYDYLRLLFSRIGEVHCYKCGRLITQQTAPQIVDIILDSSPDTRVRILAPKVRGKKGEYKKLFRSLSRDGIVRVRVDGRIHDIADLPEIDKNTRHEIEAVVDRLIIKSGIRARLADSVELALDMGNGTIIVSRKIDGRWTDELMSELYACPECRISLPPLAPRMFSFNSPYGACPKCDGLGTRLEFDVGLIVPDNSLSIEGGAIAAWRRMGKRSSAMYGRYLSEFANKFGFDMSTPWRDLPEDARRILLYGTKRADTVEYGVKFPGVIADLKGRFKNTESDYMKKRIHRFMSEQPCPRCKGARLRPESLAVYVGGKNIRDIVRMNIEESYEFTNTLSLKTEQAIIAKPILKEVRNRLSFLISVGLPYINLDRLSSTLSGGEAQRIRLATQVGSGLVGVCYVLDEPTIGLHPRDTEKLLSTLTHMRDIGNTVIVVEHDRDTIRKADQVIDIGPGAGTEGGRVLFQGTPGELVRCEHSLTGQYLAGAKNIRIPRRRRRTSKGRAIEVVGAAENNLKDIDVAIPTGVFVCVTGVSGSGKSSLVNEVLLKGLRRRMSDARDRPGACEDILGLSNISKVIEIDQSPIGRTPRSNPATYTGVFDEIRKLYSMTRDARIRGYTASRFSFNVKGGRCEACQGQGIKRIEMHFLPDVFVTCEECRGLRFNSETLEIKYRGMTISNILDMTAERALKFFRHYPNITRILKTLTNVGLGYIALGQPSTTLSGGEAQRVKLANELSRKTTKNTLYVLDEPTTGLHFDDINKLLSVLNRLVDMGNSVVVIEHNLDVIKTADYIIDLGPEGGDEGGCVIACGTPEVVSRKRKSYTGRFLRGLLAKDAAGIAKKGGQQDAEPKKATVKRKKRWAKKTSGLAK